MVDNLDLFNREEISTAKIYYFVEIPRTKYGRYSGKGEIIFKRDFGVINNMVNNYSEKKDEERIKIIENFITGINLNYNYLTNKVEKRDYHNWFGIKWYFGKDLHFNIWDIFAISRSNLLSVYNHEGIEKKGNKEISIISGILAKYPFWGNKCKIWIDKEYNFIHKFIIYSEKDEPIFTLEVTEVEVNPEIDDKEFSTEIPPDFTVVDITEQFAQQYRILVQLYDFYNRIKELEKKLEVLRKENEELKEMSKEKEVEKRIAITKEPVVLFIDRENKFVVMGGREDDLVVGEIFEVYRGSKLLGKLEITRVYQDLAVAEPVMEGLMDVIKEGDSLVRASSESFFP
ncbi:MAG: hypothetical protein NC818_05125 [Candidatus Omnitrophica bacterium]|nr:hypothetical protein [Candidatus Omnitrophota bacterium]